MRPKLMSWKDVSKYIYYSDVLIVDLRDSGEYKKGHIRGAWNIPYEELEGRMKQLRGYKRVILYCDYGNQSMEAARTLAAAMILLSPWRPDRVLVDPFCGSGTIPIEAAMIALDMAPGMNREFVAENWSNLVPKKHWYEAVEEAQERIRTDVDIHIQGYDISEEVLRMARANAELAGVDSYIHFQQRDVKNFSTPKKYGFVISNPPYGERLSTKEEMFSLYKTIGQVMSENNTWSFFLLSGYEEAQKAIAAGGDRKKATKNRKIYNGMLKTYLYQYMGEKPPRRKEREHE